MILIVAYIMIGIASGAILEAIQTILEIEGREQNDKRN